MNGDLSVGSINGSGFSPTNLVINPEFTINQRGAATRTTTSSAYNFDRWYYDGTNLLQGVENNNLRATTYVISWEGSSTCAYSLNTAAAGSQGGQSYTSVTNGGTITIASVGSNNLWLRFTSDLGNLNKVMLVQGTEQSVFVARPYGTELSLCQRYYWRYTTSIGYDYYAIGVIENSGTAYTLINHPVIMRAAPTVTDLSAASTFVGNNVVLSSIGIDIQGSKNSSLIIQNASSGWSPSKGAISLTNRPGGYTSYIGFGAEL